MDNLLLSVTRFWYELRESKKRALAALIAVTHCWHTVMSLHPNPSDILWLESTTRTKVILYKTKFFYNNTETPLNEFAITEGVHMSVYRFQLELVFAFVGHRSRRGL